MNGIEMMSPSDIRPYERNPRRNDDAVEYVANSIREFGFRQPIVVDKDMTIIVGHTRWKAAKKLGLKKVPVLVADDLTPEQAAAYRIADNSTADVADWDFDLLTDEMEAIDDFDMSNFGDFFYNADDGNVDFSNLEERMGKKDRDYEEFLDKFKPKHTTDDCFTPSKVYDVVLGYVKDTYGIDAKREIVRPFYPGGDYQSYDYPEGCVVVDNPPYSINSEICRFYLDKGIDFFLFADARTVMNGKDRRLKIVLCGISIVYENGAEVPTCFLTNMGSDDITVSGTLYGKIEAVNPKETKDLNAYIYPDNLITSMTISKLAKYGIDMEIPRAEPVRCIGDYNVFGGGRLISDRMAEKVKAEKVKAEKVKAEKVKAEKVKIPIRLTEKEMEIIDRLNREDGCPTCPE